MGLFSAKISAKEMVPLCRQLATSYDAGIPILRSLDLVAANTRDPSSRAVMTAISDRVKQGATLGEAAREQKKYLPEYFVELLASGEYGGKLDAMLRDAADYYEDRVAMGRQITGAMVYPAIQLSAAWFLGTFALGLTQAFSLDPRHQFNLTDYISGYIRFQGIALGVFAGIFVALVLLSRWNVPQRIFGGIANYVWPLKNVTRKFSLARFFRTMSLLIGSGVNIRQCIRVSADVAGNPYIKDDLLKAEPMVANGATLVQSFSMVTSLTPMAREMLNIGEQTGNLEGCLRKVSEYHFAEANHAVQVAVKVMNFVILLLVAGVIGYMVITFYQRYFSLYDQLL